jgi:hypothetical protein
MEEWMEEWDEEWKEGWEEGWNERMEEAEEEARRDQGSAIQACERPFRTIRFPGSQRTEAVNLWHLLQEECRRNQNRPGRTDPSSLCDLAILFPHTQFGRRDGLLLWTKEAPELSCQTDRRLQRRAAEFARDRHLQSAGGVRVLVEIQIAMRHHLTHPNMIH